MVKFIKKDLRKLYNIGDYLCTPDLYFSICTDINITIIGGGVWDFEKLSIEKGAQNTILWGAGRSIKPPHKPTNISHLNFLDWGIRDRLDVSDKSRFLPCVSCLNKDLLTGPTGSKTLHFFNANRSVSSEIAPIVSSEISLKNDCSYENFIAAWSQSNRVITNSYHGIYWALLSGREVIPYGYSSKFINVVGNFGIRFPENQIYDIRSSEQLAHLIRNEKKSIYLKYHQQWLSDFRCRNILFSEKLQRHGLHCALRA